MDRMNILVVEDEPVIAADIADRLLEMGYEVLGPVAAGEAAAGFFSGSVVPDLVLMDIQLEGEWDGIKTAQHILAKHAVPIIFLTSNSDDSTFEKAKKTQPAAFLSKPFRGRDLKHAIELAIRQSVGNGTDSSGEKSAENTFLLKDRLFLKMKDRMVRLFYSDILWVEADDYYCRVSTKEKEFMVTQTLKKFGEELADVPELMRVHRSYIVNLLHIEEIGELYLHIGKGRIPYSKQYKEELMMRLRSA